ncbi:LacI family DNA-binding transcriptional regulator [Paenibacillus dendritiformis]|uniref:LacI family DNA-binding transcriptional regulator n=1 Tax=Paenibacillus TaxID=44249 RepID=UPI00105A2B7D|nr:LacI family DNA-binding transcriptional regulator [Paenibacillus dendritiformis]TDL52865.1 LacI family transcriptional regulator [Paenibacillus dendritiformis]WGU92874.1 LacI family DNA-binding transcriptional regulator [Paenibacillus dendritiformis]
MSVTIIDVAKQAGVSPSTVSRVLSNHPRISAKTAQRVREVMADLGYHPNVMAKSLVSKVSNTIAVLLHRPAEELFLNLFFSEVMRGLVTQASRAGFDLLMTTGATEQEELEAVTRLVKGKRVDGVILLYSRRNDPIVSFLEEQQFPFVLIGRSEEHPDILSVNNDNVQAAYDATRHLIDQGHRRIGFVSGPSNLMISKDRMAGYQTALREAGIVGRPEWIVEGEFLQESGYRAMSFFMSLPERPTALVAIDDVVAFGVLRGLMELGYRVPDDLSLVSFNNVPLSELATPPITSVDIGIYQLGYTASQTLIRSIKGEPMQKRLIIPHRLIVRESSLRTIKE